MALQKRSVSLHGHRTSVALEAEFWAVIDEAVRAESRSLASLIAEIDDTRDPGDPLSSAIRVWVLKRAQWRADQKA
ncbi:ribbon-helix-helix domain-containing protein [Roseibium alexandrii]|uniref:ribbon-helix-helix domain-containing protein n=1 Tax=Roseibium alexandrii TaxID=388408 RepID=UPI0006E3D72E|nr:ribbon-helix-helix domain-containing protein [Roseibium alexandrii]